MLIAWGTSEHRRKRGWVADWCPICQDFRPLRAHDAYSQSHFYFLPVGRGRFIGHFMRCAHCRRQFGCNPERYAAFAKRRGRSVEALVEQTHPQLPERVGEYLARRDLAAAGEVTDAERRDWLDEPFRAIADDLQQRKQQIHIDRTLLLTCVGLVCLAFVFGYFTLGIRSDQALILAWSIFGGLAVLLLLVLAYLEPRRYARRRYRAYLVKMLGPLNPTLDELTDVLATYRQHKRYVGRAFKPAQLHAWLSP